jgi:hypothetical protein
MAGFISRWRTPELRFVAVSGTLIVVYGLAWAPGEAYQTDGMAPAVLAAGSVLGERWITCGRPPRLRRGARIAAPLVGIAIILLLVLPILPTGDVHHLSASSQRSSGMGDTGGWPQLTPRSQRKARPWSGGRPPTSIFTGYCEEAAALDVLGSAYHLPPVLSGHNAY